MKLFKHQIEGIKKTIRNKGICAFYWDVGTGKTRAALEVFKYYKSENKKQKLFVVCPIALIESSWADDIRKFCPEYSYENLRKSQTLDADILLINYEAIISKKFRPTLNKVFSDHENTMIVLDESQRIKSYNAKTTKVFLELSKLLTKKIIMSGSPAPNIESEYWSQMTFLSQHVFGGNYFSFRNRFFCISRGNTHIPLGGLGKREMMSMMQRGYEVKVMPDAKRLLVDNMSPYCMFVNKREVLDLPDEINQVRYIQMTKQQAKTYKEMWRDMVTEIKGQTITVPLALAKLMKCRQITGGFLYNSEGKAIEIEPNPKLNELKEVMNGIGKDKKVIIFANYKWEIETIRKEFASRLSLSLYGATKDKEGTIREFSNSRSGVLVAHPLSAGVGLSFNDCDYMIFYSMDYSYMNYYQCKGRIMRAKKKNNATYIHLLIEKSIDMDIYKAVQEKETNNQIFRRLMK